MCNVRLLEIEAHTESCRAVRFINDGQGNHISESYRLHLFRFSLIVTFFSAAIVTASSDRSILATDLQTGSPIARLENAHEYISPLFCLYILKFFCIRTVLLLRSHTLFFYAEMLSIV